VSGKAEMRAFLSLGGNIGDPGRTMADALMAIDADAQSSVRAVSSLYRTPPWGKVDQPDFLNAAAEVSTTRTPRALLELCLQAERKLKRVRGERWGPRVIDLDILVYDGQSVAEEGLQIPHPRMLERAFVLVPLAEIAPGLELAGQAVESHIARLDLTGIVKETADGGWWTT
jgi:2-amino-4-hydroxy-6-hydroxymethyldihydropteridine diphosphokinase